MNLPRRVIGTLALVGLLGCQAVSAAGPLVLTIGSGRVTLSAQDVPLRQILAEWERMGGMRVINRERVPGTLITIELTNVSEEKAMEMLLRPIAGFMAVGRTDPTGGASVYSRVIIMPGSAAPVLASAGGGAKPGAITQSGGSGRPQMQRRVLANGDVVNFIDNPNRPGDMTIVDDGDDPGNDPGGPPSMMRPPFGASGRPGQAPGMMPGGGMPGSGMPGGDPDQIDPQPAPVQSPSAMPTMPTRTLPTPGVLPAVRPGPGQPPIPPGPPRPPGR
jgi:hypothetical protein